MSLTLQDFTFKGKVIPSQPGYERLWSQWKVIATPQLMPAKGPAIPMSPKELAVSKEGTFVYPQNATLTGDPAIIGVRLELRGADGNPISTALTINGILHDSNAVSMTDFHGQTIELLAKLEPLNVQNSETQGDQNMPETTEIITPIKEVPGTVTIKTRSMKGRAIDKSGAPVKGTPFIIYGGSRNEGYKDLTFRAVAAGKTDATGNFVVNVPGDAYLSAFATLGIAPDKQIDVALTGGLLPEFTLLVLDQMQEEIVHDHEGCACEDKPGRLPEMDDLMSPESNYQQDIGGSCVNFTAPNRALEEYAFMTVVRNTDPEIMNAPGYLADLDKRIATLTKAIAEAKKIKPTTTTDNNKFISAMLDMKSNIQLYTQWNPFKTKLDQIYKDNGLTYTADENKILLAAIGGQTPFGTTVTNLITYRQTLANADKAAIRFQGVSPANGNDSLIDLEWMEAELKNLQLERQALPINGSEALNRKAVSRTNQIKWDSPLPLVQPASIAHGHLLHFRQVWRADGYSMGDLLYSLPLAPGQKKQIVIHDWERRETAARGEETTFEESLSNSLSQDRDINEIVNSTLREQTEGHSKVKSKGFSAGGGLAINAAADVPVEPNVNVSAKVGYSGGMSMSNGKSESFAEQKSARDISANSMQHIREKTMQSATALRSQRSTVVTSMSQQETTTVRSEFVANYNHCHAITIQYFEVLRHLAVHTELVDVQECLFIPLTLSFFDDAKVMRWVDILRYALRAPRSKYERLLRGFDSLRRYYDVNALGKPQADVYYNMPEGRYCDEKIDEISGTFRLRVHFGCPQKTLKPMDENGVKPIVALMGGADGVAGPGTAAGIAGGLLHRPEERMGWLRELMIDQAADAAVWRTQLGFIKEIEDIRHKVNRVADDQREAVFQAELTKVNAVAQFGKHLSLRVSDGTIRNLGGHMVLTRSSDQKRDRINAEVSTYDFSFRTTGTNVQRDEILKFGLRNTWRFLPQGSQVTLERIQARYESRYLQANLLATSPYDDLLASESLLDTPVAEFERVSPRQEDLQLRSELLDHLNANMEYYHKAIWVQMDSDRRMMLLEGFDIELPTPNPAYTPGGTQPQFITPSPRVSVASVIENRLIGIVGNSLIMPVAKGFNLNPAFQFANDLVEVDGKQYSRLMAHYMPDKGFKETPFRISLPTKGVFAEAVMGACNSCEKIDNSRFWKWEEHPIPDSPTEISPVSTESRRAEPTGLTPTAFAEALLRLQEGKDLPDPTGLAKALELLGKGDLFKDITGLAGNQTNALEAMRMNTDAAKRYAEIAADLAKSAEVAKNGNEVVDGIKKNVSDPKKQQEMIEKYYDNMLGGSGEKGKGGSTGGGGVQPGALEQAAMDAVRGAAGAEKGKTKVTLPDGTSVETEHEGTAPGEVGSESMGETLEPLDGADSDYVLKVHVPIADRQVVADQLQNVNNSTNPIA